MKIFLLKKKKKNLVHIWQTALSHFCEFIYLDINNRQVRLVTIVFQPPLIKRDVYASRSRNIVSSLRTLKVVFFFARHFYNVAFSTD